MLAVADLVDNNKTVIFDSGKIFAIDKATGEKQPFERKSKGWDLIVDLQAPDAANQYFSELQILAKAEQKPTDNLQIQIFIAEQSIGVETHASDGPFNRHGFRRL